jgi:hypothetical protein
MANPKSKARRNDLIAWSVAILATLLLFTSCFWCGPILRALNFYTNIASTSPNGRYEIRLQEMRWSFIDRNFRLLLRDTEHSFFSTEIFFSPDEGRPAGTEKFYWSGDSRYAMLTGRHFSVEEPPLTTSEGDLVYLVVDTQTNKMWCNVKQWDEIERITPELLQQLGFEIETKYVDAAEQASSGTQAEE